LSSFHYGKPPHLIIKLHLTTIASTVPIVKSLHTSNLLLYLAS
jgi:hypothetical protein